MKRIILLYLTVLAISIGKAGAQGIVFHQGTFEEARAKAVAQDRIIFIDFYTTWCGPCKMMSREVFNQAEVGEFFNRNFICCKLDAEKEGRELAARYKVGAYPTLLFLNAEGETVNRITGAVQAGTLLDKARKVLEDLDGPDNLVNLKKRYETEKDDEEFLKKYITRVRSCGEQPTEAFNRYLRIQTSMKPGSSRMMEYLMANQHMLVLGNEGERILRENFSTYRAIATSSEEKELDNMRKKIMRRSQGIALETKDVRLYELFLERWLQLEEKPIYQDYTGLYLNLLELKGDIRAFRKGAVQYLDSIVEARTPEEVKAKDDRHYAAYEKEHPLTGFIMMDIHTLANKDLEAGILIRHLLETGTRLAAYASRKELKHFGRWIAYGNRLIPENRSMVPLEAEILMRQGKKTEAVSLLEEAARTVKDKRALLNINDKLTEIKKR